MKKHSSLPSKSVSAALPALTVYNQGFAVVRDTVPLDLKSGVNEARFKDATARLEPDSVILRDPAGKHSLQILEQSYRNDPVSQQLLLSVFEGKEIDFQNISTRDNKQTRELIRGKIIRSGYQRGRDTQPIVEVNGKLQFTLPGQPLFPSLGDDTILKPTLNWLLHSDEAGRFNAEISYVTGGFSWQAHYNLVASESGDTADLIGWITMHNASGRTFENAKIKLMAGDVNKIVPQQTQFLTRANFAAARQEMPAPVVERTFDEYHLYTIARPTTLRDQETKQIEFVRGDKVQARTFYIYDGVTPEARFFGGLNGDRNLGTRCNKKVQVVREFVNSKSNDLGVPLPKGKLRFYRRNDDGQLEFTGEDTIDHMPTNEVIRVKTGNTFDVVGERTRTDFEGYIPRRIPTFDATTGQHIAPTADEAPVPWIDESLKSNCATTRGSPWIFAWSSISIAGAIGKSHRNQMLSRRRMRKPWSL